MKQEQYSAVALWDSIVDAAPTHAPPTTIPTGVGLRRSRAGDLERLLYPRAVAVVGASSRPTSPSGRPVKFLVDNGFTGRLYPVNPSHREIMGFRAYPTVRDLPEPVDVAVIAVPAAGVLSALEDCRTAGVPFAIVLSSGFAETGVAGAKAETAIAGLTEDGLLRVLGPNCEGLCNVGDRLPLTFSPVIDRGLERLPAGRKIAVVSQSGGLGFALFDHGLARGQPFSHIVSTGNECDLEALEVCAALGDDDDTSVVCLIFEGLRAPAQLRGVSELLARSGKHLLALKLGTSGSGCRATLRHTAHDAGDSAEYSVLLRQYGVYECRSLSELLDAGHALSRSQPVLGERVGIISSSGGAGTLLADECERQGLEVPELSKVLQSQVAATMPAFGSPLNPIDITAQAVWGGGFAACVETLGGSGEVDVVALVTSLTVPGRLESELEALQSTINALAIPVIVYSYTDPHPDAIRLLGDLGVPLFASASASGHAVRALLWAGRHPAGVPPD